MIFTSTVGDGSNTFIGIKHGPKICIFHTSIVSNPSLLNLNSSVFELRRWKYNLNWTQKNQGIKSYKSYIPTARTYELTDGDSNNQPLTNGHTEFFKNLTYTTNGKAGAIEEQCIQKALWVSQTILNGRIFKKKYTWKSHFVLSSLFNNIHLSHQLSDSNCNKKNLRIIKQLKTVLLLLLTWFTTERWERWDREIVSKILMDKILWVKHEKMCTFLK